MTRNEIIRNHRKMWDWLADNPGRTKADYLWEFDPEEALLNDCYLCEYVRTYSDKGCMQCLIEWPGGWCGGRGLYHTWCEAMENGDYTRAAKIARRIAELPEREVEE